MNRNFALGCIRTSIFLFLSCLITTSSYAQQLQVSGSVTSADGTPLKEATVSIRNGGVNILTNDDGRFSLTVAKGQELVVSYVGFITQQFTVNDNKFLNVILVPTANSLNEVIVTGLITQKRSEITSAVSTISGTELLKSPVSNITNSLSGKVSGVIAVQSSGRPGMNHADLYIRGQVSPDAKALIVVDGVERETFGDIDPNEIESITVLKDAASTALYGIKGANGVFVVTTKMGRTTATRVSFTSNVGIMGYASLPGILPAYESALLHTEGQVNIGEGANRLFTNDDLERFKNKTGDPLLYPDVNWYKALTRPNWIQTQNNINVSGGSKFARYFTSFGHTFEDGMFKDLPTRSGIKTTPSYNRYNFRANVDFNPTNSTVVSLKLAGRLEKRYSTQSIGSAADWRRQFEHTQEAFVNRILFIPSWGLPFFPEYTKDAFDVNNVYNKIVDFQRLGTNTFNPYAVMVGSGYWDYDNNVSENMISVTQKLDKITRGLSFKGLVGYTASMSSVRLQTANYALYNLNRTTKAVTLNPCGTCYDAPLQSIRWQTYGDMKTTIQLFMNYARSFGPHTVAGNIIGTRDLRELEGASAPFANQGLVFNTSYNFANKYFAQINGAYNGSENYPQNKRYGLFPALSLGYTISKEKFMTRISWISNLKIRGSIGLVGRENFGGRRFLYLDEYRQGNPVPFGDPLNSDPTYFHSRIGNQFITWEKSVKRNIGVDASFFKDKFGLTFDIFDDRRYDILLPRNNTSFATYGESLPDVNYGENYNAGYEVELTHRNHIGKLTYGINAQLSFARNEVLVADEPGQLEAWRKTVGQRINQTRGYQVIGFYTDTADISKSPVNKITSNKSIPGDFKYADINNDGVIDNLDQTPIGFSNIPEYVGGLNVSLGYKGFSVSVLFQGVENVSSDLIFFSNGAGSNQFSNQYYEPMMGRWTPDNPNPTWPVMRPGNQPGGNPNETVNDFLLQDASYIKLRNAELRYDFSRSVLQRLKLQGLSVYVNAQNLKTWTKFYGLDPENNTTPANVLYNKRTTYPSTKVINFGLNVQL